MDQDTFSGNVDNWGGGIIPAMRTNEVSTRGQSLSPMLANYDVIANEKDGFSGTVPFYHIYRFAKILRKLSPQGIGAWPALGPKEWLKKSVFLVPHRACPLAMLVDWLPEDARIVWLLRNWWDLEDYVLGWPIWHAGLEFRLWHPEIVIDEPVDWWLFEDGYPGANPATDWLLRQTGRKLISTRSPVVWRHVRNRVELGFENPDNHSFDGIAVSLLNQDL
ncbi:hypothetical protein [Alicyclobacillus sendaiensis]|uniref:Sulfotransferase family protein n=1 Tax=Alicyclobacillus sendaiensis PA2 TaxID=3029425 RepID=A0ABT6Y1W4_ALISE|nr:hypothetical protein [Alicyclobacillus sendaiensis]MDI9261320.1 hypothetical protein [Alicyclobacillus sendaiensis PA2]